MVSIWWNRVNPVGVSDTSVKKIKYVKIVYVSKLNIIKYDYGGVLFRLWIQKKVILSLNTTSPLHSNSCYRQEDSRRGFFVLKSLKIT